MNLEVFVQDMPDGRIKIYKGKAYDWAIGDELILSHTDTKKLIEDLQKKVERSRYVLKEDYKDMLGFICDNFLKLDVETGDVFIDDEEDGDTKLTQVLFTKQQFEELMNKNVNLKFKDMFEREDV